MKFSLRVSYDFLFLIQKIDAPGKSFVILMPRNQDVSELLDKT